MYGPPAPVNNQSVFLQAAHSFKGKPTCIVMPSSQVIAKYFPHSYCVQTPHPFDSFTLMRINDRENRQLVTDEPIEFEK